MPSLTFFWPGSLRIDRDVREGCVKPPVSLGVEEDEIVSLISIGAPEYGSENAPLLGELMLVEPKRASRGDARRDIFDLLFQPFRKQRKTRRAMPIRPRTDTPTAIPTTAPLPRPLRGSDVVVEMTATPEFATFAGVDENRSPSNPIRICVLGRCVQPAWSATRTTIDSELATASSKLTHNDHIQFARYF